MTSMMGFSLEEIHIMNNERWLSQNFFIFFFTWGVYLQYWPGWLAEAKGLSVTDVSIIMGAGLIARAISTMFLFPFASKFLSNRKLIIVFVIASIIVVLFYIPMNSFSMLFIITFLFSAIYPSLLPAVESSAATLMKHEKINYGKSRSFGSIGFVISVLLIGTIIGAYGEEAIVYCMVIFLVVMFLMQMKEAPQVLSLKPKIAEGRHPFSMKALWGVKGFPVIMTIVILLQGALASYYSYSYLYLQYLEVNPYHIGIVLNVAVVFEILFLLNADKSFVKWNISSLFLAAAAGSTIRWTIIFLFPNVWAFILSQTLHSLSFAMAHYAFIQYITRTLPTHQIANAQGLYSALAMSLSTAVLTLFGGYLYEISPGFAFLGMIVFTIPAVVLILGTRKKYQY